MDADWLVGVERWRKSLPAPWRTVANILMGLTAVGISMLLFGVLFLGFTSGNAAIGLLWFGVIILILYAAAEYHDRRKRRR